MARKHKKSVWGIYPTRLALETAIDRLRENGFLSSDISVLLKKKPRGPPGPRVSGPLCSTLICTIFYARRPGGGRKSFVFNANKYTEIRIVVHLIFAVNGVSEA
jgi:hypothetical protein